MDNNYLVPDCIVYEELPPENVISLEKYMDFQNETLMYYLAFEPAVLTVGRFGVKEPSEILSVFDNKTKILDMTLYTISNAYVHCDGSISINGNKLASDNGHKYSGQYIKDIVDRMIVVSNHFSNICWGHLIIDTCYPLIILNQSLISTNKILMPHLPVAQDIFMEVFGIKFDQLVFLSTEEVVFCHEVITFFDPIPSLTTYVPAMNFKRKLAKLYGLDAIKAEKYCYNNRMPTQKRCIHNMEEIISAAKAKFNIIFHRILDMFPSVRENAIVFAAIKLLFCPAGSGAIRGCFMKNNSVIIFPAAYNWSPGGVMCDCIAHKIFLLQYKGEYNYFKPSKRNISVTNSLKYMSIAIYCAEHSKWPNSNEIITADIILL